MVKCDVFPYMTVYVFPLQCLHSYISAEISLCNNRNDTSAGQKNGPYF